MVRFFVIYFKTGNITYIFVLFVFKNELCLYIYSLLVLEKKKDAQLFLILSTVAHYSLFPLIFTKAGKDY